jgi:nucleoside-diphosphate-sugar epimerase
MNRLSMTSIAKEDCEFVLKNCRHEFERLAGKDIMITGCTGFVGRSLLDSVLWHNEMTEGEKCHLILPVRNRGKLFTILGGKTSDVEIVDWAKDGSFDRDLRFDLLIHAASPSDPRSYLSDPFQLTADTINLTESVVRSARTWEAEKILYISSGAVYGHQPDNMPSISEEYLGGPDIASPISSYGEAKRIQEALCVHSGIPSVCARLFSIIGPHQDLDSSFAVPNFINSGLQGKDIVINGDGSPIRGYCYSSDLCSALWKLLLGDTRHTIYNVGSDRFLIDIKHLARLVADSFEGIDVLVLGREDSQIVGSQAERYVPDITRLKSVYEPKIDIKEGLRRTIAHHVMKYELVG